MFLLVKPNGGKYWRLQYRNSGKQKLLALGVYADVILAEARDKQAKARKLIAIGEDPMDAKREQKRAIRAQSENSFENIAREWHDHQKGRWTEDHASRVLGSLAREVFPFIGHKPIHELSAPAILEAVRRVKKRNALDVASRVLQRVNAVFCYAICTGRTNYDPAADLKGTLKSSKVTHRAEAIYCNLLRLAFGQAKTGTPLPDWRALLH